MMIENHKDYQDVRGELRAMGISINVIEYVEHSMKIAYELGGRDAIKDCAQQAASGAKVNESYHAFGDC